MSIGRFFALAGIFMASISGCASSGEAGASGGGGSSASSGATGGGEAKTAELRFAHLSPDVGAVDFCLQGGAAKVFSGPYMSAELSQDAGLAYGQVTKYLIVPEGTYTARFVPAGQGKCDPALTGVADVKNLKLESGKRYTAAAIGELAPPDATTQGFSVKLYADRTSIPAGKVSLTFIHASPDAPKVDLGTGTDADFKPIFADVAFGEKGQADGKAYFEGDPMAVTALTMRPSGTTTDALVIPAFTLPADKIATVYGIGNVAGVPKPLSALVCIDNDKPEGSFTKCTISP